MKPSKDLITVTCRVTPTQKQDTHTEDIHLLLHSISARNQQWIHNHNLQCMSQVTRVNMPHRGFHCRFPCSKVRMYHKSIVCEYVIFLQKQLGVATVWGTCRCASHEKHVTKVTGFILLDKKQHSSVQV